MTQWLRYINIPLWSSSMFFQVAAVTVFLHCFFDNQIQWNRKVSLPIAGYILSLVILYLVKPSWMPLEEFDILVCSLIVCATHPGKRLRTFGLFLIAYMGIWSCCNMIEWLSAEYIFSISAEAMAGNYTIKILVNSIDVAYFSSIFFYLYKRIYKRGLFIKYTKTEERFAAIYIWTYLAIMFIHDLFDKEGTIMQAILGASFLLFALFMPVFIFYKLISKHYQEQNRQKEVFMEAELAHFQQYKLAQEETARFRHDIKNNLLCATDMLRQGKAEEANAYLQDLLEGVETLSNRHVTGDEILDSILAFKAQKMEEQGIDFRLDGVVAGGLSWKPVDICNVFANALDNAIEACERLPQEDRQITMTIKATMQNWLIRMENPVLEAVDTKRLFKKKDRFSSKSDPQNHGLGTYTMKHTVETYGGALQAEYADHKFLLDIMIPK